jgi:hypothetical protein
LIEDSAIVSRACIFPPELVPLLRERAQTQHPCMLGVSDASLAELLTIVFFAGLATEEGKRYVIRVAFVGTDTREVVPPGGAADVGPMLVYRWSAIGFQASRALSVATLIKLAAVCRSERVFIKVGVVDGVLAVLGLAREGLNADTADPYIKMVVSCSGRLSIYSGREHLLDYDGGRASLPSAMGVLTSGPVRRSLEAAALRAGLSGARIGHYIEAVHGLVREMRAHGKGGILVIRPDDAFEGLPKTAYLTRCHPSLTALLKNLGPDTASPRATPLPSANAAWPTVGLRRVLHAAFANEVERAIEDVGGCTAMDGATILNHELGLIGFGVILSVLRGVVVEEAIDSEAARLQPFDLSARGARHRAAASYAHRHKGCVVFVASQDGPVSCLLRDENAKSVAMWRFGHESAGASS